MARGSRGYISRGSSYRGSNRGGNPWSGGGYGGGGRSSGRDRYSSSFDSYDNKGRFTDRYRDDYPKAYRMDNYSRDRHSPERKRPRNDGPSRHEYGGGRYDAYPSERRGYSSERNDRHMSSPYGSSRREEFRKPPSSSSRGGGRGRMSSRGSRGIRRDRGGIGPPRRRLNDRSYVIRKRGMIRPSEYSRRGSKVIRMRSSLTRRRRVVMSSEKESSDDEEEKEKAKSEKEDEDVEMKEDGAGKEGEAKVEKEGEEGAEKPKEKKEKKAETAEPKKKTVYKYICPQCNIKMPDYRLYENHLQSNTHLFSMRKVAGKQRSILAQMRQAQRNSQNELEKSGEGITDHTVFCPLCKLNYKQERAVHMATSAHKNMRKFLMPTCKVCKHTFKSPMVYEHHLCTVEHLRRKQKLETSGEGEEDNLDEFTTIDSIGEVDENADEPEKEEKAKKKVVSVGIEQIKKIEAHYCDLCRMFLPRGTDNEYPDILAGHCRKRFHMQRYIRFKENEDLKKKAEKLQRKENAEKEKKKDGGDEAAEKTDVKKEGEEEEGKEDLEESKDMDTSKSADDDKLWDAVDKDLGELLEETDGREDDDDEERVNGERYDRFKVQKEKNGEAGVEEEAEKSEKAEEGKKDDESKK